MTHLTVAQLQTITEKFKIVLTEIEKKQLSN